MKVRGLPLRSGCPLPQVRAESQPGMRAEDSPAEPSLPSHPHRPLAPQPGSEPHKSAPGKVKKPKVKKEKKKKEEGKKKASH